MNHPLPNDPAGSAPPEQPDVIEQVQALCRDGRHEEAVDMLKTAILRAPERRELLEYLGNLLGNQRNHDAELSDLGEALRFAPHDALLYVRRAEVHLAKGYLESAVRDATEAINLDPSTVKALGVRAIALGLLGQQEAAMADVHRQFLLTASPEELAEHEEQERLEAHFARGHHALEAGQYPDAIQAFSAILLDRPDDTEILLYRGRAYHQSGQHERAWADLIKAWELKEEYDRTARGFVVTADCYGKERILGIFPATVEGWKETDALATGVAEDDATRAQYLEKEQKLCLTRIYFCEGTEITEKDYVWAKENKPKRPWHKDKP